MEIIRSFLLLCFPFFIFQCWPYGRHRLAFRPGCHRWPALARFCWMLGHENDGCKDNIPPVVIKQMKRRGKQKRGPQPRRWKGATEHWAWAQMQYRKRRKPFHVIWLNERIRRFFVLFVVVACRQSRDADNGYCLCATIAVPKRCLGRGWDMQEASFTPERTADVRMKAV